MTYRYRDPKKCEGYVPALPPKTVFRRSGLAMLDPFACELFSQLMTVHFAQQSSLDPESVVTLPD